MTEDEVLKVVREIRLDYLGMLARESYKTDMKIKRSMELVRRHSIKKVNENV